MLDLVSGKLFPCSYRYYDSQYFYICPCVVQNNSFRCGISSNAMQNRFLFSLGMCMVIVRSGSKSAHVESSNLCSRKNGGCHGSRKCMAMKAGIKCGDCPVGWANDGPNDCKKTSKGYVWHIANLVG